ncbi:hypothetical protein EYZ11_007375 [Aspergillus tanneri]|uniref:Uncharacterized protein n=1 Tax=Aspergillus tanneri TaxID=1220188 RepID=A0A4S3JDG9_9EURO|nr:hypothetical protein EYZ11_007375 [Aspergillus tanneri]
MMDVHFNPEWYGSFDLN